MSLIIVFPSLFVSIIAHSSIEKRKSAPLLTKSSVSEVKSSTMNDKSTTPSPLLLRQSLYTELSAVGCISSNIMEPTFIWHDLTPSFLDSWTSFSIEKPKFEKYSQAFVQSLTTTPTPKNFHFYTKGCDLLFSHQAISHSSARGLRQNITSPYLRVTR